MNGFSTLEVLAGSAIVGVLALSSVYFTTAIKSHSSPATQLGLRCDSVNRSIVDQLAATVGPARRHTPNPALATNSPVENLFDINPVAGNNILWTGLPPYLSPNSSSNWQVSLSPTTSGLIRALEAWYNGIPGSGTSDCSNFMTIPAITGFAQAATSALAPRIQNQGTQVRLEPFDLATGNVIAGCPRPIIIAPIGAAPGNAQYDALTNTAYGLTLTRPSTTRTTVGIRMTLRTQIQQEGIDQTCELVRDVSAEPESTPPARPYIAITTATYPAAGDAHRNSLTVAIQYPAGQKKGVTMLCRDRSTVMPPGGLTCYYPGGAVGIGPGPQYDATGDPRSVPLPAWNETVANQFGASRPGGSWAPSEWVRCDQVSACGRRPDSSAPTYDPTTGGFGFTNSYSSVRSNCIVRIESVTVDAGGNLDFDGSPSYHPRQLQPSASVMVTQTARPTCGNYCTWGANVYFQAGACCSGAGCVEGQVGNSSGPILTPSLDPPF